MPIRNQRRRESVNRPLEDMSDDELLHIHMRYRHPDDPPTFHRSPLDMLRAGEILRARGVFNW